MMENIPLQPNEEIKPIQGYEGLYSITSFGRVWSHKKIKRCRDGFGRYKGKFLKQHPNGRGYLHVVLCKEGKLKTTKIHILVATHFISNSQNLLEVNHEDGNKLNCRKDNLEWCTDQDNKNHALINGLINKESSKFYGVCFHKGIGHEKIPWGVHIRKEGKQQCVGYFKTEIEAAQVYNSYVIEYGLNRPLNNI